MSENNAREGERAGDLRLGLRRPSSSFCYLHFVWASVRVEICNGFGSKRGAWRLSVLLLFLWGTIYVSHFSSSRFSLVHSAIRTYSTPRTRVPNVSCMHTHTLQTANWPNAPSISIYSAICFSIFRSSSACQKRIIEKRKRNAKLHDWCPHAKKAFSQMLALLR